MRKKSENNHSILNKLFKVVLLVAFVLMLMSVTRGVFSLANSGSRISDAQKKLDVAKEEQESLKRELEEIQSSFFQEKQARDKLGMAKEGEIVIILPEESMLRRLSPRKLEPTQIVQIEPNWRKWAKLFFEI